MMGRPDSRGGPRRDRLPMTQSTAERRWLTSSMANDLGAARRRRQDAARSMARLPCGCRDPLRCDLARWCPFYDGPRPQPGLAVAADYFDGLGVCVCWTVPRRHREAS